MEFRWTSHTHSLCCTCSRSCTLNMRRRFYFNLFIFGFIFFYDVFIIMKYYNVIGKICKWIILCIGIRIISRLIHFFFRPSLLLLLFIFINIKYSEPLPSCNVLHLFKFVFHFFTAALYLSSHVVRRLQCKRFDVVYTPIYST